MLSKKYAVTDTGRCVACGACTKVCPREAVCVWKGCYAAVVVDKCVGCGKCAAVCPADCITLKARENA